MKVIFAVFALVAVVLAAPSRKQKSQDIVVVKELLHDNVGLDSYKYNYQLSDGQEREENAELVNVGTENEALVVRGSFSWIDPATNYKYTVNYVADENGFRPEGVHIPSI